MGKRGWGTVCPQRRMWAVTNRESHSQLVLPCLFKLVLLLCF
jgi:hypothetical protein